MIGQRAAARMGAMGAALLALAGCQGIQPFLPRDETPVLPPAFAVEVPRGPSGQRVDENGFPLLGHMPRAAAPQASAEIVSGTQARYANVATRGTAATGQTAASLGGLAAERAQAERTSQYRQSVEELRALAEAQRTGSANR